jgi:two-component sensor histidine kinase
MPVVPPNRPSDVLITEELHRRTPHNADYKREKLAIQELAQQMVDHPEGLMPGLVRLAIEACDAQSAGISLYEPDPPGPGIFRWHHLVGHFANLSGSTIPRDFSPSGIAIDRGAPVLMARPERVYPYLAKAGVPLYEALLLPLYTTGTAPAGTLWVVTHDEQHHFDSGDARVMTELAAFAGLALRMIVDAAALRAKEELLQEALDHQEMLTREMSHRVKNLLAITSGIVTMSGKSAGTPQEMTASVLGRLRALTQAHSLIQRTADSSGVIHTGGTVQSVVETILRPYEDAGPSGGRNRSIASGPAVQLGERALTSLALVFHEMATNAAKYGALSAVEGQVQVTWRIEAGKLLLRWEERAGPRLEGPPTAEGFGGLLARRSVAGQLGGELLYDWQPGGVCAIISIPMERLAS